MWETITRGHNEQLFKKGYLKTIWKLKQNQHFLLQSTLMSYILLTSPNERIILSKDIAFFTDTVWFNPHDEPWSQLICRP